MKKISLLFLLSYMVSALFAQHSDSTYNPYEVDLNKDYLKAFYYDSKAIAVAPFHWKKKQWMTTLGVTAIGTGLYFGADQQLKDWSQREKTETSDKISAVFEKFGNGRYPVFTTGAMYLTGAIFKEKKLKRVSLLILESYLITGISSQIAKFATSRHRPWSNSPYNRWEGPRINGAHASFFSGHSSTVFSFATVFAEEFKHKKWVPPLAYTIASLSALSRIHDNAHWASDVFIGSAVGYFMTKLIVKNHTKSSEKKLSISSALTPQSSQMQLQYRF